MRLIVNATELANEFRRCLKQYSSISFAVAWGGKNFSLTSLVQENIPKISQAVVGLHFYQTHPDFIETFYRNRSFRFIEQTDGTFHPKMYLFYSSEVEWELIVGSSNFTDSAFGSNTEANILVASNDPNAYKTWKVAKDFIDKQWRMGVRYDSNKLAAYRLAYLLQRPKRDSLSGHYGKARKKTAPYLISAISMSWNQFITKVNAIDVDEINQRLQLLKIARSIFEREAHFHKMSLDERKFLAGIDNRYHKSQTVDWGFFGSMVGAGIFKKRIIENDIRISWALDQIPLNGPITRPQFVNYVKHYREVFPGKYIGTATRLLVMKRPDVFYCITSKNKTKFCETFNVVYSHINYDTYWDLIVRKIQDSEWWNNPKPKRAIDREISSAGAAFLDVIFYER